MKKNELLCVSTITWRHGRGEWIVVGGTHTADKNGASWDGSWCAICCPWFQVRFERHLMQWAPDEPN